MKNILNRLLKIPQSSRMFNFVTLTWNPVVGCKHLCKYCWARRLALTKLANSPRYRNGFRPKLIREELRRKFREGELVFVSDMGELFGEWVPKNWIQKVLECIKRNPKTLFLLLTKNPKRYLEFIEEIPQNCILGITIETNRDVINGEDYSKISKAPKPSERMKWVRKLRKKWKGFLMIAIEPIMDFDLDEFSRFIEEVLPTFVVIGKDNYRNNLPEPQEEKIKKFYERIRRVTYVKFKKSLQKLEKNVKKKLTIQDLQPKLQILGMIHNPQLLKKLISISDKFNELTKVTPLKLISLSYIIPPYLRIVGKLKRRYSHQLCVAYIDLFAGSGLNKVGENIILGSPILVIEKCRLIEKFFDRFYFIEKEFSFYKALKERLEILESEYKWLKDRYEIIRGDCNAKIKKVINELNSFRMTNSLTFVDPNKWEIKWKTLEELFKLQGDFLIVHQSRLIAKEVARYNDLKRKTIREISDYFGEKPEVWCELTKERLVKTFYIRKIREHLRHVETIHLKSGRGYSYYLIFGSKVRRINPPWWKVIQNLKEFIEESTGTLVDLCFKIATGKIKTLLDFRKRGERVKRLTEF